jgi:transposase-like protein
MASRYQIRLSASEERELRSRVAQYTRPHREVVRAKIVLLAGEGHSNAEIARRLDCTERTVHKWRRRFHDEGLAGLDERPRPGRPRSFPPRRDRRSQGAGLRAAGHLGPADLALVGG